MVFLVVTSGARVTSGIEWVEARDAIRHLTVRRPPSRHRTGKPTTSGVLRLRNTVLVSSNQGHSGGICIVRRNSQVKKELWSKEQMLSWDLSLSLSFLNFYSTLLYTNNVSDCEILPCLHPSCVHSITILDHLLCRAFF